MFSRLKVFTGNANVELAKEVAKFAGIPLGEADVFKFSNDNTFVKINENVRGADTFIIQPTCYPVNDNLMELLIMIDALKRASAQRINCVIPIFGYARSDKKDQPRIPITAKLVADLLGVAGADRIVAMDLHSDQIQGFFDIPVDHLNSLPIFVRYFTANLDLSNAVIVSPDTGGTARARALAARLDLGLAIGDKRRTGNDDKTEILNIIGDVEGKIAILFDDIIDTGGSLCKMSNVLMKKGAKKVYAACAHGILSGKAIVNLEKAPIEKVFITNSVPLSKEKQKCKKIVQLSIAELLATAIKKIHIEESLSILFR
ncbi:MAG: ribose-phosphate pyrophosphokinase [Candidatus Cloacimonetes bacterium]|nr:ribose-phosphate pyrophosphokinase [Candidatus Cloacimonadota bacterium]MCF7813248.1 ribose-phosphate pyrophosphokinase [Candidatus Cloacimonadota bacterium]MCF7867447.1 ribose-phosphate pyrophosphokinase [Candidatus Cloacimonadota bacterium]MCF7882921.1 ribose-phosphate pyrophosphokinase [Candidatus Cloacimonadota bacterium]